MTPLNPATRRALRARAHHLDPVVAIGQHGLTPAVLKEIDVALTAHELIKVRVLGDDRDAREALLGAICEALDAAPVQHLGKLLVLFRPKPPKDHATTTAPRKPPRPSAHAKSAARPAAQPTGRSSAARTPGGVRHASAADPRAPAGASHGPPRAARPAGRSPGGIGAAVRAPRGVPRAALPRRRRGVG